MRYQGFEEGIGSYKPADPRLVFQRRFGDCKDKTFLLQTLLKLLGISSTPVLVNTGNNVILPEMLPHPEAFNHAVLQIDIKGTLYWVEPTRSFQGGSLQETFFPDYRWGLLIAPKTKGLSSLPSVKLKKPVELFTSIVVTSPDSSDLTLKSIHTGSMADFTRDWLARNGVQALSEACYNEILRKYNGATIVNPMAITDDRHENKITIVETYKAPLFETPGDKGLTFYSIAIDSYFAKELTLDRSSPYVLPYPFWVKEHIHIENPFGYWLSETDSLTSKHDSFRYNHNFRVDAKKADFHFELRYLKDHIAPTELQNYWSKYKEILTYSCLGLPIQETKAETKRRLEGPYPPRPYTPRIVDMPFSKNKP